MSATKDGKKSDRVPGWIPVVAGAIERSDGRVLMHQRPSHKHHGGLWEFPGGKVESGESPVNGLVRELDEELGIKIAANACSPVGFAEEPSKLGHTPIVIFLYRVARWAGEPCALEGGAIGWFEPHEIEALAKPPLDIELARGLLQKG